MKKRWAVIELKSLSRKGGRSSANLVGALEDRDPHSSLRKQGRGGQSSGTSADDYDVSSQLRFKTSASSDYTVAAVGSFLLRLELVLLRLRVGRVQMEAAAVVFALILGCASAPGQTPAPAKRLEQGREFLGLPAPPDPQAAARGQKIFVQNCGFCHGERATGGEGPDLVRSTVVLHDDNGNEIGNVVLHGRPDRGMPAFPSFTPEQIRDVAAFLHQRVEESANRYGYKLANVLTGNASEGKKFFDKRCAQCHSASGDLAHIGSKLEPSDLLVQFLMPATKQAIMVSVRLPSGEAVDGKLKQIDSFTISLWDHDGEYREWSRARNLAVEIHDPLQGHKDLLPVYTNSDMHNMLAYLVTLK